MKKLLLPALLLMTIVTVMNAQSPPQMNYQAVVRDVSGAPLASGTAVTVWFRIHDGNAQGNDVYDETRTAITNQFGLITIAVGDSANLAGVNWGSGPKFLQVQIDPKGGTDFVDMGTSQLLSVPYAMFAGNATAGATGPTGAAGYNGYNGATGATGPQGFAGFNGATGPEGPTGPQGAAGVQGPAGVAGLQGLQGAQGLAGSQGQQGAQGPQGIAGVTGPQGVAGVQGSAGSQGNTGPAGAQGPTGVTGAQGPQGNIGVGIEGPQGNAGAAGATGATGPSGNNGSDGIQGIMGATGAVGDTGVAGLTGATGTNGINGSNCLVWAYGSPPSGHFALENGDNKSFSSATLLGVYTTTQSGADATQWLAAIVPGSTIQVTNLSDPTNFGIYTVTGTSFTSSPPTRFFNVTFISGNGVYHGITPSDQAAICYTLNGAAGATGTTGANGSDGVQGLTGPSGQDGAAGVAGPSGQDGAVGPAGPSGQDGAVGAAGPSGQDGATGATGATGFLQSGSMQGNTPYWDGSQWQTGSSNIYNDGTNAGVANTFVVGGTIATTGTALDVESTTGAFLPPRMSDSQRDAIPSPQSGMIIFDNTSNTLQQYILGSGSIFGGNQVGQAYGYSGNAQGQTFQVSSTSILDSILVSINNYSGGTVVYTMKLYDGFQGSLIATASNTFTIAPGGYGGGYYNFSGSTISLTGGQSYYFEVTSSDGSNYYMYASYSNNYPNGQMYVDGTPETNADLTFYMYTHVNSQWLTLATGAGVAGPAGPMGATGDTGVAGPTGPIGLTGANGNDGMQGATGVTGPSGQDGAAGTNGNDGAVGATGPSGQDGAAGITGATGPSGQDGAAGPSGADGTNGSNCITWNNEGTSTGNFMLDNANFSSATLLSINTTSYNGADATAWLQAIVPGTTIQITCQAATNNFGVFTATGVTIVSGIASVNLVFISGNGSYQTGNLVSVCYTLNGTAGAAGAQGLTGATGANGSDGAQGVTGATGPSGQDGAVGATGATGATGIGIAAGNNGDLQYDSAGVFSASDFMNYNGGQLNLDLQDSLGGLHVMGQNGGEASIALQPDNVGNAGAGQWVLYTNGSQLNSPNDFGILNAGQGGVPMVIQELTNNVGIGTNNPQAKLEVNGAAIFDFNVGIGINTPGANLTIRSGSTDPSTYASGKTVFVTGAYNSGQGYDGGVEFRQDNLSQGIGFGFNTIYATGYNTDQDLNLIARGAGNLTLQAYGGATGNVGIGTTTPGAKLEVDSTFRYVDGNQHNGYVLTTDSLGNATWQSAPTDTSYWSNNGNGGIYVTDTTKLVGIGTSAPQAALDVNGNVNVRGGTVGNNNGDISLTNTNGTTHLSSNQYGNTYDQITTNGNNQIVIGDVDYWNNGSNLTVDDYNYNISMQTGTVYMNSSLNVNGGVQLRANGPQPGYVLTSTDNNGDAVWQQVPQQLDSGSINAIASPGDGQLVYNTSTKTLEEYIGSYTGELDVNYYAAQYSYPNEPSFGQTFSVTQGGFLNFRAIITNNSGSATTYYATLYDGFGGSLLATSALVSLNNGDNSIGNGYFLFTPYQIVANHNYYVQIQASNSSTFKIVSGPNIYAGGAMYSNGVIQSNADLYFNAFTNTAAQGWTAVGGTAGATGAAGSTGATGPSGQDGLVGATGATGPTGATGAAGVNGANCLTWNSGDEGTSGQFAVNAPFYSGISNIFVNTTAANGGDATTWLSAITAGSTLQVTNVADNTQFGIYTVTSNTNNTGFRTIGVSFISGNGFPSTASAFCYTLQGPTGATGPSGGPVGPTGAMGITGATGPSGQDGATGATGPSGQDGGVGPIGVTGATGADGTGIAAGNNGDLQYDSAGVFTGSDFMNYNGNQLHLDLLDSYGGLHVMGQGGTTASISLQPDNVSDGSSGQWQLYTHGHDEFNLTDFAIYDNAVNFSPFTIQASTGFVGIGQSSNNPTSPLEVMNGALTVTSGDINMNSTNRPSIYPGGWAVSGDADMQVRSAGNGILKFNEDNGGNIEMVNGGGNVGIGLNNPAVKLDVNGNVHLNGHVQITDLTQQKGYVLTSDSFGNASWQALPLISGPTGPSGSNGLTGATGPSGTNGTVGATGVTGPSGSNGATGATGPSGQDGSAGAAGAVGATGATGATGDSQWTLSGNDIQNNNTGNVFIQKYLNVGEVLNANALNIHESAGVLGDVVVGDTTSTRSLIVDSTLAFANGTQSAGYVLTSDSFGNASWQAPTGGGGGQWTTTGLGDIYNNNPSGNVGIGISTPAQLLEVNGTAIIDYALGIGTIEPTQSLEVDGGAAIDGFLGVGTQYPNAWLDVEGNVIINDGNAVPGYVLTATDSSGDATWQAPQPVNGNSVTEFNDYQATSTDHIITVANAETITLPQSPAKGQELIILSGGNNTQIQEIYNQPIQYNGFYNTTLDLQDQGWMSVHLVWSQYDQTWFVISGL